MTTKEITFEQLPGELRRTARRLEQAGVRAMRRAARRGKVQVLDEIGETKPYQPVDSGEYKQRWSVASLDDGADLFNPTVQAAVIELGARPHMPPFEPIYEWVWRKNFRGAAQPRVAHVKWSQRKKRYVRKRGDDLRRAKESFAAGLLDERKSQARDIANAIRWHIYTHGQKGKHVLGRASHHFVKFVSRELDRELDDATR